MREAKDKDFMNIRKFPGERKGERLGKFVYIYHVTLFAK